MNSIDFAYTAAGHRLLALRELFIGDVFQAAIDHDVHVDAVPFPDSAFVDIGTPDGRVAAVRTMNDQTI